MKNLLCVFSVLFFLGCDTNRNNTDPEAPVAPAQSDAKEDLPAQPSGRQGTDFFAHGEKPSWTLELDYEGDLIFTTLDGDYLQCPIPEAVITMEGKVIRYHAVADSGVLDVTIEETLCPDPISGMTMTHVTVVEFVNSNDVAMPAWEGCGSQTGPMALKGTWNFSSMDETPVSLGAKGAPSITFNLKTNQVSGNGGCNRYSGTLAVADNQIKLGLMAATKMACSDLDSEVKLLQRISNATFNYEVNGMMLTLKNSAGELVLEKAPE